MREKVLSFLKEEKGKRYAINELYHALELADSEAYKTLAKTMNALEEEARILPNQKNQYTLIEYTKYVKGILDVKDKGFGFLMIEDSDEEDIYIPPQKIGDAMNNDYVLALVEKSPKGFKKEGEVKRIITRHYTHIIGTLIKRGEDYHLISDDKSIKADIMVPKEHLNGADKHDKVKAEIISYAYDNQIVCKITHSLGNMNAAGVDVLSKVLKHNIDETFPQDALNQAKQYQSLDDDFKSRRDLRDRLIFTIDGEDAKDFDDAIEISKNDDGTFFLGVHIADVSHYVNEDSPLDKEAFHRGTSIYLVDRVIPMLPENLSNNLCSLMPKVDRFTVSCEMQIDANGRVIKHEIFESVIQSKARMTYTKINQIFNGDQDLKKTYAHLLTAIEPMHELAKILREKRHKKGSLDFETDEAMIKLNDQGKAIDVTLKERGESEKIIEEFMLIANQTIAQHIDWMNLPFIYRVHEEPKEEKLEKLITMAKALGFSVKGKKTITHQALQKLLKKVEDTASEKGINMLALRSMQKAEYSPQNLGHFGLAFKHYTHFTSPIRRYPDLIVHRLLRQYLFDKKVDRETIRHYDDIMPNIADDTSKKERNAVKLERDVLDMKKAEFMADKVGQTFEGQVSSVTNFGLYVTLPNTVEGLIHISELGDDYYVFNEDLLTLVGRHKRTVYRMGQHLKVKLESVNIAEGEIDFTIAGGGDDKNKNRRTQ